MKAVIGLFIALLVLSSCEQEKENGLIVKGTIKGLKVGNVLLQKAQDTTLITLDSIALDGSGDFTLTTAIAEPQLLYLYLDVKDGSIYDDRISFFAEDTVINITSTLENFEKDAVIKGSKNQDALNVFKENNDKLNIVYTDLVKRSMALNADENASTADIEALNVEYDKYLKKRILYAVSYAGVHRDKEIAPYILLQEGFDANPKLLDSIYNLMPKKIQTSLYGKELSELLKDLKEN